MKKIIFLVGIFLIGCGSEEGLVLDTSVSTSALPYVNRVSPAAVQAGATVTVFGFGFSNEAPSNIIVTAGVSATAATYALVSPPTATEIEQITFVVPAGATLGVSGVSVTVFDNTSNNNVLLTINP